MALPKKNRLTTKKEIDCVFKNGRTVRGSFLFVRFLKNQKRYSRFVFIIPAKSVSLAVDRNRIKRTLSGKITKTPALLARDNDVAVVVFKKVNRENFKNLAGELTELMLKT